MNSSQRVSSLRVFLRSQATALLATVVDVSSLVILTEIIGVYYVLSTAVAAGLGAVTNFMANRFWAFDGAAHAPAARQALRYAVVSLASLGLNTAGVFFFTEYGGLRYLLSKAITAVLIAVAWNYPLQRYFVFRKDVTHVSK